MYIYTCTYIHSIVSSNVAVTLLLFLLSCFFNVSMEGGSFFRVLWLSAPGRGHPLNVRHLNGDYACERDRTSMSGRNAEIRLFVLVSHFGDSQEALVLAL